MRATGLATLLLVLAGCEAEYCTLIGCGGEGATIDIESSWPDGIYTLEAAYDGQVHTCTATLPTSEDPVCDGDAWWWFDPDGTGHVQTWSTPPEIELTILRDDTQVFSEAVSIPYEVDYPNGEDCGPACRSGSATVTLDDG